MGVFLMLPIVAFDVWLACTTGRREMTQWKAQANWRNMAAVIAAGLALAVWLAFFFKYGNGGKLRMEGFPIPIVFFHLDNNVWTSTTPPAPLPALGKATNFLTGLAAPFIPFKIAEFFKVVKAELK